MKKNRLIPIALFAITTHLVFAADEIHYTITGKNSVTFDWRGTALENSIGFGLSPGVYTEVQANTPNPIPNSSKGPFWEAKLTGLKENSVYYYSIGNSPERTFRTAPASGSSGFTVYAQGDIGNTTNFFNMGVNQDIIASGKPAFVIGLGNLTLGSTFGNAAVDQHFNDVMAWSKESAYMPVWGNLDWPSTAFDNFGNYKGRFDLPNSQVSPGTPLAGGKDWYWFDYGNTRFITLPEPWAGAWADWGTKADVLMSQAQLDTNINFIVTLVNQPAYSSGHYPGSATLKAMVDALGDRYNKYKLNINARSRNYERSFPQHGVVHVTAGIGGVDLLQDGTCLWLTCTQPAWSAFRTMHLGALKLDFTAADIKGSFICGPAGSGKNDLNCAKGSVVDSFTLPSSPTDAPAISKVAAISSGSISPQLAAAAITPAGTCTQIALNVSGAASDGGFSYFIAKTFGAPPDTSALPTRSTLRLFENGLEIGPAHANHADISSKGLGRFSHKANSTGAEALRFSASNNTNPKTNGKTYTYCTTTTVADTQAPSIPMNVKATASSSTQVNLTWSASTDNIGVTGYKIYRNGVQIGTVTTTSYSNTGLSPATSYTYTVVAFDAAGNSSGQSTSSSATTSATVSSCLPAPKTSLIVNVKDKGAKGNGATNDTSAIQAAIDQVAVTGGTVLVPDGTYLVDALTRLNVKSNVTFRMTSGAVLKALPNGSPNYGILRVENASNVNIVGGKVQGERNQHQGTSGQWGQGVEIYTSSNVVIEGVTSVDNWGDGFYISKKAAKITVCSVIADNNRRMGLSIVSANGILIKNSIFMNTNGQYPYSGFDIEPNIGDNVNDVQLLNSEFHNNQGSGIELAFPANQGNTTSLVTNVTIDHNTIYNNGTIGTNSSGIKLSQQKGVKVTNNIVRNNMQNGIIVVTDSIGNIVTGNAITNNGNSTDTKYGFGILLYERATNNTVTNNTVMGNNKNIIEDPVGFNTINSNIVN